jgi:hypothetical protein
VRAPSLVVLLLVAAGCGGADDRLPAEEFHAEANAICAGAEQALRELPPPADTAAGVAAYAHRAVPILSDRHERLGTLRPPEPSEAAFEELLRQAATELEALRGVAEAALEEDQVAAGEASRKAGSPRSPSTRSRPGSS